MRFGHLTSSLLRMKPPASKWLVAPGSRLAQQPLGADLRPVLHLEVGRHRDRLLRGVLDVDLEVVLEVLADSAQLVDGCDPDRAQVVGRADAGELHQLRRVDRAAAEDDLAAAGLVRAPAARVLDADRPAALEDDARGQRHRLDLQVGPVEHRVQVGARGRQPAAVVHVAVEHREALLLVAVDVIGQRVARLLHGLEEGVEERPARRPALEHERPVVAAPGVVGARPPGSSPCA